MKSCNTNRLAVLAVAALYQSVDAFTTPSSQVSTLQTQDRSGPLTLKATNDNKDNNTDRQETTEQFINPIDQFYKPIMTAATSTLLATSLLFSNPLLPTPDAQAVESQASTQSKTATSIEIDLSSVPSLTRKAFINRDKLTNYLIDSFKSFKPILDLLSDSDTVTVTPPTDIKGAINNALSNGDAQFIVNGESVDVRIESVPGVVIVKVINPNIPRLPFLKDGSASLKFVDEIVDVAPVELEKTAKEVQSIEKFLTWGSYSKPPISYKGSSLDYWLSSKFTINGQSVSLGSLGEMTNSEVVVLSIGTGVGSAYAASYSYYMKLQREQEEKDAKKKKKMAEKKAAAAAAKKKAVAKKDDTAPIEKKKVEKKTAQPKKKAEPKVEKKTAQPNKESVKAEVRKEDTPAPEKKDEESSGETTDTKTKGRKRDAIKNMFRREK